MISSKSRSPIYKIAMEVLSQKDADNIMKGLSGEPLENFTLGFHEEKENISKGMNCFWALSSDKRIYYLIEFNKIRYLLVGINPAPLYQINLSSFARIVSQPKGRATVCLRKLIEDKLIPLCQENSKRHINARIATDRGEKVFQNLKYDLPNGIKKIEIINASCRMELAN